MEETPSGASLLALSKNGFMETAACHEELSGFYNNHYLPAKVLVARGGADEEALSTLRGGWGREEEKK